MLCGGEEGGGEDGIEEGAEIGISITGEAGVLVGVEDDGG